MGTEETEADVVDSVWRRADKVALRDMRKRVEKRLIPLLLPHLRTSGFGVLGYPSRIVTRAHREERFYCAKAVSVSATVFDAYCYSKVRHDDMKYEWGILDASAGVAAVVTPFRYVPVEDLLELEKGLFKLLKKRQVAPGDGKGLRP